MMCLIGATAARKIALPEMAPYVRLVGHGAERVPAVRTFQGVPLRGSTGSRADTWAIEPVGRHPHSLGRDLAADSAARQNDVPRRHQRVSLHLPRWRQQFRREALLAADPL